jgi:hypothetical protein
MIANPTKKEFAGMVHEKLLINCPIAIHSIDNANRIFDPTLPTLGVRQRGQNWINYVRVKYAIILKDFIQLHKYRTLVADVFFVNGLPFLVTSLRGISLLTIKYLHSQTYKRLVQTLE